MKILHAKVYSVLLALAFNTASAQPVTLSSVGPTKCLTTAASCDAYDAVVFVHGIYGDEKTFQNSETGFDWPNSFPRTIRNRPVDVFRINYQSSLFSWAKQKNPDFNDVAKSLYLELGQLRKRKYRSIGFIAHSLGGNFVSTYLHYVKTSQGHPERAQHAYVITLATPVLGSDVASLASLLKDVLLIDDDLLKSLTKDNLYLKMLKDFREAEGPKGERYGCRPVRLHAAYEQSRIGPLTVVTQDSAALAVAQMLSSPVVGFDLDHFGIVKPRASDDLVFKWVLQRVEDEFGRLKEWEIISETFPPEYKLCRKVAFIGEP